MTTTQSSTSYAFTQRGNLPVLTWPVFEALPVDAVVTTRRGGVSTGRYESLNLDLHVGDDDELVLRNRERVAAAIGTVLDNFVFCEQAHQRTVVVAGAEHRGRGARSRATAIPATDALVTTTPDVVLVIMVADCVPLVLLDPVARVLGCVHAGWRGTVRGVIGQAVSTMTGLGADPGRILAGVGPAIAPNRYQVGDDVVDAARAAFEGDTDGIVRPDGTGRWLFDLWEANRRQLRAADVPDANIHIADVPTGGDGPFFSHRFEQPCGRFAAVARLSGSGAPS
ncbi:MAG: peptidoglycan editing factor PgeF [Aldersonia sp.]|nr:peptidoglycan editing factor PgeF [Aldersonia sp.]